MVMYPQFQLFAERYARSSCSSARPTKYKLDRFNQNTRGKTRLQRDYIGQRFGVVRQRAAPLDLQPACLVAASILSPTDRSNGRIQERMLLLCFREVHLIICAPITGAPPFFLRHTASYSTRCKDLTGFEWFFIHPSPLSETQSFVQIHMLLSCYSIKSHGFTCILSMLSS